MAVKEMIVVRTEDRSPALVAAGSTRCNDIVAVVKDEGKTIHYAGKVKSFDMRGGMVGVVINAGQMETVIKPHDPVYLIRRSPVHELRRTK